MLKLISFASLLLSSSAFAESNTDKDAILYKCPEYVECASKGDELHSALCRINPDYQGPIQFFWFDVYGDYTLNSQIPFNSAKIFVPHGIGSKGTPVCYYSDHFTGGVLLTIDTDPLSFLSTGHSQNNEWRNGGKYYFCNPVHTINPTDDCWMGYFPK